MSFTMPNLHQSTCLEICLLLPAVHSFNKYRKHAHARLIRTRFDITRFKR
jgi:hypothetical protein